MAESPEALQRSRAILLFCGGFILLGGLFLGTLYFSGQRGDQLQKLASTDRVNTVPSEVKKQTDTPKVEPKQTPETKTEENKATTQPETKKPDQSATQPVQPKQQSPPASAKPLPATGIESAWMTFPAILIIAYAVHEYRRSRHAIQRAAFHETAVF